MRLGSHIVRFDLRGIPVVGNTITGALVGLTPEGAALCDAMLERDVAGEDIPVECEELVSYLAVHGFEEGAGASEVPRLSSAYLHVSNTCNLSCVGCYSADCNRNRAADPSLDDLCRAIDVLAHLGVTRLVISGGEPFLREDLAEVTQHARGQGMTNIAVLTNGTHCSDLSLIHI